MVASSASPKFVTSYAGERFELLDRLGSGASGSVYRARSTGEHRFGRAREVCVKRLAARLTPDAALQVREEACILAAIRHAHVVSIVDMGEESSGAPFLVLEFIRGADLKALSRAVIERGDPIPDAVAVHIACALLRALGAVQRALPGLVHRDVTPHNVLVSSEGEIKLTDFGIALAMNRARRTRPRVVKGKFGYMAPEQIQGRDLDVRADLFSVGVILFEMLAGRRPWFSAETTDELTAIGRGEIASIVECRPDLPPGLAAAVDRMLALDRRDRYADCDAALRAIAHFSAGDTGSLRLATLLELAIGSSPATPKADAADRTQTSPGSNRPGLARASHGPSSGVREGADPTVPRAPRTKRASSP